MIYLHPDHLKIIHRILNKYLSNSSSVWVFGSRAKGTARKYSDLDLAIDVDQQPLSLSMMTSILDDFEESDLPYKVDKVDIVDWNTISDEFRRTILSDRKSIFPIVTYPD